MTKRFLATLYVWPYSGVARAPAKYTAATEPMRGSRSPEVYVDAKDFEEAVQLVSHILRGIRLDERVWQCGITGLTETSS